MPSQDYYAKQLVGLVKSYDTMRIAIGLREQELQIELEAVRTDRKGLDKAVERAVKVVVLNNITKF